MFSLHLGEGVVLVLLQDIPKVIDHCAKVRVYCSACDHLIRKISSGMFQKCSSFEEFHGFSKIDVHFLNELSFFYVFRPLILLLRGSDDHRPSNKPEPLYNDFYQDFH